MKRKILSAALVFGLAAMVLPGRAQDPATAPAGGERMVTISETDYDHYREAEKALASLKESSQRELEAVEAANRVKVDSLENIIKEKDEINEVYTKKYINIASNLLYIPYDSYSINNIVVPAEQEARKSGFYNDVKVRFDLLSSYGKDTEQILAFCRDNEKKIEMINRFDVERDIKELRTRFNALPAVIQYKKYDDYKSTFLGRMIVRIENAFSAKDKDQLNASFKAVIEELSYVMRLNQNN